MLSTFGTLARARTLQITRRAVQSQLRNNSTTPSPSPSFPAREGTLPDSMLLSPIFPTASTSKSTPQSTTSYLDLPDHQIFLNLPPAEDPLLQYFASWMMMSGKRHAAQRRIQRCLLHLHAFTRMEPLPLLRKAVDMAAPNVRVVTHKSGGKSTIIPVALNEQQRARYAVKEILEAAKKKPGKTVEERLARELLAVLGGTSAVLDQKRTLHKLAMVNRCVIFTLASYTLSYNVCHRGNIKEPRL